MNNEWLEAYKKCAHELADYQSRCYKYIDELVLISLINRKEKALDVLFNENKKCFGSIEVEGNEDSIFEIALFDFPYLRAEFNTNHQWFEVMGIDADGHLYRLIWQIDGVKCDWKNVSVEPQ